MKKPNKKNFLQILTHKYRLILLDENTFEQKFRAPLNLLNVVFFFSLLVILGAFLSYFFMRFTPNIYYNINEKRDTKYLLLSKEFAKAKKALESNSLYINEIQSILSGRFDKINDKNILLPVGKTDLENNNLTTEDSLLRKQVAIETGATKEDESLRLKTMLKPIQNGDIAIGFDAKKHAFLTIKCPKKDSVQIIENGRVVVASKTRELGYLLVVSHRGGFLSVYKNIKEPKLMPRDPVKKGQKVATVVSQDDLSPHNYLTFELWKEGVLVNPNNYIDF